MSKSEVECLKEASAILETWNRRHHQAGIAMAIPLVASFIVIRLFPSVITETLMALVPAIGLTMGLMLIPEDFRSRRGSLTSAICFVAVIWAVALIAVLIRLFG